MLPTNSFYNISDLNGKEDKWTRDRKAIQCRWTMEVFDLGDHLYIYNNYRSFLLWTPPKYLNTKVIYTYLYLICFIGTPSSTHCGHNLCMPPCNMHVVPLLLTEREALWVVRCRVMVFCLDSSLRWPLLLPLSSLFHAPVWHTIGKKSPVFPTQGQGPHLLQSCLSSARCS